MSPWKYLGFQIHSQTIQPQLLQLNKKQQMIHDLQRLLGTINWASPLLGITSEDLATLYDLLKGDTELNSPRLLTYEAKDALEKVSQAISTQQAH